MDCWRFRPGPRQPHDRRQPRAAGLRRPDRRVHLAGPPAGGGRSRSTAREPWEQPKPDQRWRGLPLSLYTDRHGVFQAPPGREGQRPPTLFARAMTELGINQVFARSPQAKGRVEQLAGTFQDRLVTDLRHAAASTFAEAQAVLERFLPRFNARFRVEAAQVEPAYRTLDLALDLGAILAFRQPRTVARSLPLACPGDNTVKYRWRTLQLLPGPQRTSYASSRVQVVERADGALSVRQHGEPIASRLAPPLAGTLCTAQAELASHPYHERIVSGRGSGGVLPSQAADEKNNGAAPQAAANGRALRPPIPCQLARWKAIQQARRQGLSIRSTTSLLGISRVTVSNYVHANGVPGRRTSAAPS